MGDTPTVAVPRGVRVEGDLFHGRIPAGAVYVGRAAVGLPRSRWANPFRVGAPTPATVRFGGRVWSVNPALVGRVPEDAGTAVLWYASLVEQSGLHDTIRAELGGRDLACWCRIGTPCHRNILLIAANGAPE